MARVADFDKAVPLPPGLTITAIRKSVGYVEKELSELVDIYYERPTFSVPWWESTGHAPWIRSVCMSGAAIGMLPSSGSRI
jgi:hypothetical protein